MTISSGGRFITVARGKGSSTPPGIAAGSASFLLDNSSGDYDEAGLRPGDTFNIQRVDPADASVKDLGYGYCEVPEDLLRLPVEPLKKTVAVRLNGTLSRLAGQLVTTTGLFSAEPVADAMERVLDAAGIPPSLQDLGVGETTLLWFWADNMDALQLIQMLAGAEGPTCLLYEAGDGTIVFRGRNWRTDEARSVNLQATFRTDGASPLIVDYKRERPGSLVFNRATIDINHRAALGSTPVVWDSGRPWSLGPGQTLVLEVRADDGEPFQGAVQPVLNTDYTVSVGSVVSATLDRFSGGSVTLTIVAHAVDGALLDFLQMRAEPVPSSGAPVTVTSTADALASITQNGLKQWSGSVWPEIDESTATDIVDALVDHYIDGRARATIRVHADADATTRTTCLTLEIGDRVRVIEGNHGIDEEYWIEAISHEINAPLDQFTTYRLERAD